MPKQINLILISLFLLFTASACGESGSTQGNLPQIEIISLQTTPSLEHWLVNVAACAADIPDFSVVAQVEPMANLDINQADLILRLGKRQENDPFVSVMGLENIIILAGTDIPPDSLSQDSLKKIFSGEVVNWNETPEVIEASTDINQTIQTLSYPEGHELRLLFQGAYLEGNPILGEPWIFSTTAYLQELLESQPYAIGYTLESQLPAGANTVSISGWDETQGQHTVLAVTQSEPTGKLRQLLLCLQD